VIEPAEAGYVPRRGALEVGRRYSEGVLARALDAGHVGLVLLDRSGRMLLINHAACELLGHRERDLAGRAIADFAHPDDRGWVARQIKRLLAGRTDQLRHTVRLCDSADAEVRCDLSAHSVADVHDLPAAAVIVLEDAAAEIEPPRRLADAGRPASNDDSLVALLRAVAELDAASPSVLARKLYTRERILRTVWSVALRENLVERARYDPSHRDWQYRLTECGRDRLAELAPDYAAD
jgi:PAS domain S-box-containing protein